MSKSPKKANKKAAKPSLEVPSELSTDEYRDLLSQIQSEFSLDECQGELLDAARYNDIDVVRGILKCYFNLLDFRDETTGNSALHMAAANGHGAVVELLLAHGANAATANQAGNTPLHWASANGQTECVQLLLEYKQDVLQRNEFGRSALTEGFTSEQTELVKSLLEHESATEERLMESTAENGEDSVTHSFLLGRKNENNHKVTLKIRELPMARSDKDSILGQASPDQDTTGLGIWAASLVCAQWMVQRSEVFAGKTVVELGAGCGVPGLAVAQACPTVAHVHLTDFNPQTVKNLQHNQQLNKSPKVTVRNMNWQDPSTFPEEKIDIVIGADLIYQSDMVPLLMQTILRLLGKGGRFLYVAPETGRQGQGELFAQLKENMELVLEDTAPDEFSENPLESQDEEDCFLHFNELKDSVGQYKLYEFRRTTS